MRYDVWYMKPEFFREGIMGFDWCLKNNQLPDPTNLNKTHVHLIQRDVPDLESLFYQMQGEIWSPNGEASDLIEGKSLHHTSMSVGDIAVDETGAVHMADRFGFVQLTQQAKDRPFTQWAAGVALGQKAVERLNAGSCPMCGSTDKTFNDVVSQREHNITGLCQKCQDGMFAEPEE